MYPTTTPALTSMSSIADEVIDALDDAVMRSFPPPPLEEVVDRVIVPLSLLSAITPDRRLADFRLRSQVWVFNQSCFNLDIAGKICKTTPVRCSHCIFTI